MVKKGRKSVCSYCGARPCPTWCPHSPTWGTEETAVLYDPQQLEPRSRLCSHGTTVGNGLSCVYCTADNARFTASPAAIVTEAVAARDSIPEHYRSSGGMQPLDVIDAFGLDFYEGSALKYLLRWRRKNGVDDLRKLRHYADLMIEREER